MKRLSKAEFLTRLATAVDRTRNKIEFLTDAPITLVGSDRIALATGWAKDMEIFIKDSSHKLTLDNPVVKAIEWFARMEASDPLTTLNDMATLEEAWEYYRNKTSLNVPFLQWDGRKFIECYGVDNWNDSHRFVVLPRK